MATLELSAETFGPNGRYKTLIGQDIKRFRTRLKMSVFQFALEMKCSVEALLSIESELNTEVSRIYVENIYLSRLIGERCEEVVASEEKIAAAQKLRF
jgi:hypothetical protein